jgi:sigma-B regulation protein RsbU (phosphoserine phosphatase)
VKVTSLQKEKVVADKHRTIENWEARNLQGEMFGKEPIYDIIRNNSALSANEILNAMTEALKSFQKGAKIEDDITPVIIKISD